MAPTGLSPQNNWEFSQRHSVRFTEDYHFEIDEYRRGDDQFLLVHAIITHWTPSVMKRCRREWDIFRKHVTAPLFATGAVDDAKWRRFVSAFGFKPLMTVVTECGEPRSLYVNLNGNFPTKYPIDYPNIPVGPADSLPDASFRERPKRLRSNAS